MRGLLLAGLFLTGAVAQEHGDCPGACERCARALTQALRYVAGHQLPGGGWGKDRPVPVYSLVNGLALLATGSTPRSGPYQKDLQRFTAWLLRAVPADGAWGRGGRMETWQTAFAVLVFAALLDRDPSPAYRTRLAGLVRRLEALQLPTGGWFHGSVPLAHYSRDLVAATNLALLALHAARKVGVKPEPAVIRKGLAYYRRRQNPDGGFPYGTAPHMENLRPSAGGRTLLAWYVLTLWGEGETAARARRFLKEHPDANWLGDAVHGVFPQYFFLSTLAARHAGGEFWDRFRRRELRALAALTLLAPEGRVQPLWHYKAPPPELERFRRYAFSGGYDTAACALALLVPRGELRVLTPQASPLRARTLAALRRLPRNEAGVWTVRFGGEPVDLFLASVVGLGLLCGGGEKPLLEALAAYVEREGREYRSHWTFQHPFVLLFLLELEVRSSRPARKALIRRLLAEAARFQNPDGGWTYGDPRRLPFGSNMASTYCVLLALSRARELGWPVPDRAWRRGLAFLRPFQNRDGGFRYHHATQFVSTAGVLSVWLVAGLEERGLAAARKHFRRALERFLAGAPAGTLKGHYLTSFALILGSIAAHRLGGETARAWDAGLQAFLKTRELPGGGFAFETEGRPEGRLLARALGTAAAFFALSAAQEGIGLCRPRGGGKPVPSRRLAALTLGRLFRGGADRRAFLAALERLGFRGEEWIEIGWTVPGEGRELFVLLSRTPRQIRALSAAAFAAWQRSWTVWGDRERRRWAPLPGEIEGYGTDAERRARLALARALKEAPSKEAFLRQVPADTERLALLIHTRAGTLTQYWLPMAEIRALSAEAFQRWRRRFLTWVELHVPGQSRVAHLASLSEEAFRLELAQARHRFARVRVRQLLARFAAETGLLLRRPDFLAGDERAVVRAVVRDSPADPAGFHAGEVLLQVEDRPTPTWTDFLYAVRTFRSGSTLKVEVAVGERRAYRYLRLP